MKFGQLITNVIKTKAISACKITLDVKLRNARNEVFH